jgi:hypothetical protein
MPRPVYKFQAMFRGQQVIIEYGLCDFDKEIDYAVINNDNRDFIHPNYKNFDDYLDDFHMEVYEITKIHLHKIKSATNNH